MVGVSTADAFSGQIGKQIKRTVLEYKVSRYEIITNSKFPLMSADIIDNLSSDQYYVYKIL